MTAAQEEGGGKWDTERLMEVQERYMPDRGEDPMTTAMRMAGSDPMAQAMARGEQRLGAMGGAAAGGGGGGAAGSGASKFGAADADGISRTVEEEEAKYSHLGKMDLKTGKASFTMPKNMTPEARAIIAAAEAAGQLRASSPD